MPLLASDLDGTLIPPDDSPARLEEVHRFRAAVASAGLRLAYVTGRHLSLALEGVRRFGLPRPDALACDVGTSVYWFRDGAFAPDLEYRDAVASSPGVAGSHAVRGALADVDSLKLQEVEKQAEFKVSFYVEGDFTEELRLTVSALLDNVGRTRLVPSHDPVTGRGLLDVLPETVGKGTAVDHIVERLGVGTGETVYAGDSGNDRDALLSGMRAIVVGNAPQELIWDLQATAGSLGFAHRIYFARAKFAAGVTEGLRHFGALPDAGTSAPS